MCIRDRYGIAPLLLAGAGIKIGAKLAGGLIGNRARKREQRNAQAGYDKQISRLENLDASNPYANMQHTFEDATVNQQQSQFLAQQQQAALANTMSNLEGAAGGSGIAALAQSMASQQSANLQQASVDIGQQEQQNQMQTMAQQAQLDQLEVKGDMMSRQMEAAKGSGMLNFPANLFLISGYLLVLGSVAGLVTAGKGEGATAGAEALSIKELNISLIEADIL